MDQIDDKNIINEKIKKIDEQIAILSALRQNLIDKGNRQDAEEICNTYGRRGVHFLKPVWEEYQKK